MAVDYTVLTTVLGMPVRGPLVHDAIAQCVIDSRICQQGDCFVARAGDTVDGHAYIGEAFERGVRVCVMQRAKLGMLALLPPRMQEQLTVYAVDDTEEALYALARAQRAQMHALPVIAITGTAGKTTTKELVTALLSKAGYTVLSTPGTHNTKIGIALTLTRWSREHTAVVCELGISRRGEMATLVDLLQPTAAAITMVGHGHLEGLGAVADVATEKRSIFAAFTPAHVGVINGDQPLLAAISYPHPVIKCGQKLSNQVQARRVRVTSDGLTCVLKLYGKQYPLKLPVPHVGALQNALTAAALAHQVGVPHDVIVAGLEAWVQVPRRFQLKRAKQNTAVIIDDSYNANPESMREALRAFECMDVAGIKVAVLGDMLELGVSSDFWHRQLARVLRRTPSIRQVLLVGPRMQSLYAALPLHVAGVHVDSWREALDALEQYRDCTAILVKGSRGMALDKIVDALVE